MEVLLKAADGGDVADQYRVRKQPYYKTVADEESLYEAAYGSSGSPLSPSRAMKT